MLLLHTHTQLNHLFYSEKTKVRKVKGNEDEQEWSRQQSEEDSKQKEIKNQGSLSRPRKDLSPETEVNQVKKRCGGR